MITVTPIQAVIRTFTHCFDWRGRASRSEFWWFFLFHLIFTDLILRVAVAILVAEEIRPTWFDESQSIYRLAITTPLFFLIIRRLRDINQPVWWALLAVPELALDVFVSIHVSLPFFYAPISSLYIFGCLAYCAMPSNLERVRLVDTPVRKMIGKTALCCGVGLMVTGFLLMPFYSFFDAMIVTPGSEWINEAGKGFASVTVWKALKLLPLVLVILLLNKLEGNSVRELIQSKKKALSA